MLSEIVKNNVEQAYEYTWIKENLEVYASSTSTWEREVNI